MCTATWWRPDLNSTAYRLLFNRDESKQRGPATPPVEQSTGAGTRFIAPIDSDRGGTWLLVNEFGLTLAILNHYAAAVRENSTAERRSRGEIPLILADCAHPQEVAKKFTSLESAEFRPFFLLVISPADGPQVHEWDGAELQSRQTISPPFTTSSYESARVIRSRIDQFQRIAGPAADADALEEYHLSMNANDGAIGVRMRRPDAQTVSFSRVIVNDEFVQFDYRPETPDSTKILDEVTVKLRRK
ncbi:MAG: NRDE family protein [Verrucomicrobiota bacterium]